MVEGGPGETFSSLHIHHLVEPEASAQTSLIGSMPATRCAASSSAYLCPLQESAHLRPSLDSLLVLLWFFKLLTRSSLSEIIDAGSPQPPAHPPDVLPPSARELSSCFEHQHHSCLESRDLCELDFKVAQAFTDAFHPVCEVIRYVLLGHFVTSLSCAPLLGCKLRVHLPREYITYNLLRQ